MPKAVNLHEYPKTRAEAGRKGLQFFYPGQVCDEGHDGLWYYSTNGCVACARSRASKSQYEKTRRPKVSQPSGVFLAADWRAVVRA